MAPARKDSGQKRSLERGRSTASTKNPSSGRPAMPVAAALVVAGLASCTLIMDADRRQCATNDDCVRGSGRANEICATGVCEAVASPLAETDAASDSEPEDPAWACLNRTGTLPPEELGVPVPLYRRYVGAVNPAPVEGLSVKACRYDDDTCARPVGVPVVTDATGFIETPVFAGFRGYLELTASEATSSAIMPTLSFISAIDKARPPVNPPVAVPLFTRDDMDFIVGTVARKVNPQLGIFLFTVRNCEGKPVQGAQVRVEPIAADTFGFYTDATGTPGLTQQATSPDGSGGFVNLPPGRVTITVSRASGAVGWSSDLLIRADTISDTFIDPQR